MPVPENNTILLPDAIPEEIQQAAANKKIAQLDATTHNPVEDIKRESEIADQNKLLIATLSEDNSNKELLGLATDEQRALKFIKLHNPNDRFFINWTNVFKLGELYYSNYTSEAYRAYNTKLKLLTSKYYNPKKYIIVFGNQKISVYNKPAATKTNDTKHTENNLDEQQPLDTLDKPIFLNSEHELNNGYKNISQMRISLQNTYNFLLNQPYVEPSDKKKMVKLRNKFIREINSYYTHMYYFNRINNFVMTETEITLPQITMAYSEINNEMLPRIDKVKIRLAEDIINQKYNNEAAKLELYLVVKQKIQEQQNNPKDKKINDELKSLMKEYLEFDKLYQTKLINHIQKRKAKKIISELVILEGQPYPGDGAVVNPNEGLDDMAPSATSALTTIPKKSNTYGQSGGSAARFDDMDEKDRKRKFFFINKAKMGTV